MTPADSGRFLDQFFRQVAATHDRPAAEVGDRHLTYAGLDARVAVPAARLRCAVADAAAETDPAGVAAAERTRS